jgi:hypothetical protein
MLLGSFRDLGHMQSVRRQERFDFCPKYAPQDIRRHGLGFDRPFDMLGALVLSLARLGRQIKFLDLFGRDRSP